MNMAYSVPVIFGGTLRRSRQVEFTQEQYERIAPLPQRKRGNVSLSNLQVFNVILYVAEHGCKWCGLPEPGRFSLLPVEC